MDKARGLKIRPVEEDDCKLLWDWANDPFVRASAFSTESISWDEHVAWFRRKLNDQMCRIFVAIDNSTLPVGQIRFNKHGMGDADLDISLDARFRGLGYASRLIELGTDWALGHESLKQLHAFVKPDNVASAKAFERAGFKRGNTVTVKGQIAVHYVRTAE